MDDAPRHPVGIGVGALITRGEELLLLRRANTHGDGSWSTPGGHVDFGESLEATAAREVEEETGLVVGDVSFLGVTNDVMWADHRHYVTVWMHCEYVGGEPVVGAAEEMSEVGWFRRDALPRPLFTSLENLVAGRVLGPGLDLARAR